MAPFYKAVNASPITSGLQDGKSKVYTGTVDPEWTVAAIPNGGYVLALIVDSCIQHQSSTAHKDPIHVTAHYLRPTAVGSFEVHVRIVKSGKAFTNLAAELVQKGLTRVTTHIIFGTNAPSPTQRTRVTIDPPSSYARHIPLHVHPSKSRPSRLRGVHNFSRHIKTTTDPEIVVKNQLDSPTRTKSSTVGGGGLEWGGWFEFVDKNEKVTNSSLAFLVDILVNVPRLLPSEVRGNLHNSWFPTMVLSFEFKHPIPWPSITHADRTVGIYSVGRFLNDPDHRHDTYVEIWSAPSNIGEGADTGDWRDKQVCLATATQMALAMPFEVNEAKAKKDAKITPVPPPPHLPSSSYSFHPLHTLFFCEECDAIRCNRCVSVEVSTYYCPNCLFEVPSASVRAEKNRCARNCFMCPNCRNTLTVVATDPPDAGDGRLAIPTSTVGEPPFYLYCNHCRWDSAEVGIVFEKPTGLAAQLQRQEDSAPDSLEFDRLKEHFEPFIRASLSSLSSSVTAHSGSIVNPSSAAHSHHLYSTSITAAASAALARDIPGVGKYTPAVSRSSSGRGGRDRSVNKDEMIEYRSRLDITTASAIGSGGGEADVEFMKHLETVEEVASLEQRWGNSWATSLQTRDLKPVRIPLHSKRSKRCPVCTHILIKPEQKAQSVRYKIKLVAANYLPAITVALPHTFPTPDTVKRALTKTSSTTAANDQSNPTLHPGETYAFHLALTNPLYDPIQVRLATPRMHAASSTTEKARRPPFGVSIPTSTFTVAAFAEAWEYDEDEDMYWTDEEEFGGGVGVRGSRDRDGRSKAKTKAVGVLEKRANTTIVGGEVIIGKEARGRLKFIMLVQYTYRSDDPVPSESNEGSGTEAKGSSASKPLETKTFEFYTVVDLGDIIPKEEPKTDGDG
ncbi:hypothetical protein AX17_005290 [Amanita inopinata Kibby_2008]|nr:hypothetical protein AX17_005290 [Amanita inopinata Kibby_2008]